MCNYTPVKIFDSPQQRHHLLAAITIWEGRLSNKRVRDIFGIGQVRASQWIRAFREQQPDWLYFDNKTKTYIAVEAVYRSRQPLPAESLESYLNLVGLPTSAKDEPPGQAIWAAFPDLSRPDPKIFAALSDAIRGQRVVTISYRSMRDPQPHMRTLSPHSMVRAGRRWHVRAFCAESDAFRDYALRRIVEVTPQQQAAKRRAMDDEAWMTMVPVRLIAHPLLSFEQQEVIRFEYFANTSARVDTCRAALVPYFIQDMRAALDPETQRPPDYQLAVQNLAEVKPWVFPP